MEPAAAVVALSHEEKKQEAGAELKPPEEVHTPKQLVSETQTTENPKPSTLEIIDENAKLANTTTEEILTENVQPSTLLKQNSEESSLVGNVQPAPTSATGVEQKAIETSGEATSESILADEFRGMRLKSDDNSSLGDISVDPRLDTGSGLDDLVPPESPDGMDALEGAGSDEDSDYPEESQLPGMGQKGGFGQCSTFLSGKKYTDLQAVPRAGDVMFRTSAHVALQGSGKKASPLEMVISSKMAADTQEELMSALDKVRTLQSKVTDVEKDVSEAQSHAFDARKEAIEAKDEAIKAKQQAAEAMEEALEAKRDASQKRQDIQSISVSAVGADTSGSISQITDVLGHNSASPANVVGESLGFTPSGTPDDLSAVAVRSHTDIAQLAPTAVDQVSALGSEVTASLSTAATDGLRAAGNESRSIARDGSALAGKVGDGIQDVRAAATTL